MNMQRKYIEEVLKKKSGKVKINGWIKDIRDLGSLRFVLLRDMTGVIQITAHKDKTDKKVFDVLNQSKESVISVEGSAKKSKKAPGGVEIVPSKVELIAKAESPLPIDVSSFSKTDLSKRLDYRFLDLHREKIQAIFKIQSVIANTFRKHFYDKGFIEMQPPSIISSSSEGGTELFEAKYFEKKAYLAQSPQLYKQMIACSIGKTFTITPVWRAEKHNTIRHLNESRQMDIEMPFADQFIVMKQIEQVMKDIVKTVLKNCKKELDLLEVKNLKVPKAKSLSYEEAIKKVGVKFGDDFSPKQEEKLCEMYPNSVVFTHSWPAKLKPFYIMTEGGKKDAKLSCGFDALYGGVEISSGGQRIHLPDLLIERLKAKGLNIKNFKAYIDSFRFGAPPHSGWSIGLERLTTVICRLNNIREACWFPRDRDRLAP